MLFYYDEDLDIFIEYKNSEYLLYINKCIENYYKNYFKQLDIELEEAENNYIKNNYIKKNNKRKRNYY
jgi:hypothetical protein